MSALVIPPRLAATVVAWEGERGREWLGRLPVLVAEAADAWGLEVREPFDPGGNISWVAPARRMADGLDLVLKVQHPHPESDPEAAGLIAWDGGGAVQLYAHDPERCALLIEHCRPGTALVDLGGPLDAVRVGAAIGARLHAVAAPAGLPTLADVLDRWADELEQRLGPTSGNDPGLGRRALATMRTRPRACPHPVLLHGDLNPTNVLAAEREPWLAIDPKPMLGDPAYDGPRLILQPDPMLTPDPAATLADRLAVVVEMMGLDRDALADWCLVNAVEMGASARDLGDLATAERCRAQAVLLAPHLA